MGKGPGFSGTSYQKGAKHNAGVKNQAHLITMRIKVVVVEVKDQVHLITMRNKVVVVGVKNQDHLIRRMNGGKVSGSSGWDTSATSDQQESTVVSPEKKKNVSLVADLVSTEASFVQKLEVESTSTELPNFAPKSFSIENLAKNIVDQQVIQKLRKFLSEDEKLGLSNVEEEQKDEEVNVQKGKEEA